VLTNEDLEKMVETSNQWILERTGIVERHIAAPDVATSDLAVEAAKIALEQRGIAATELDAILVCTVTPDMLFPATACLVQHRLGAKGAWGFDIVAACSGFVYGVTTAAHFVMSGTHKKVMVIGADTMSRIIDYTDRGTCVLFGDGAGAVIIEPCEEGDGFLGFQNEIDGSGGDALKMPAGGSRLPASCDTVQKRLHFVKQEGQAVFKYAVRKMYESCNDLLVRHGLTGKDVKLMIPHQANRRIITAAADRLGMTGDDSAGHARCDRTGEAEEGRPGNFRGGGGRVHGRREPMAVELLSGRWLVPGDISDQPVQLVGDLREILVDAATVLLHLRAVLGDPVLVRQQPLSVALLDVSDDDHAVLKVLDRGFDAHNYWLPEICASDFSLFSSRRARQWSVALERGSLEV
jgi:3-oxoacyl-[acyl-carrier-protein] synthase-3